MTLQEPPRFSLIDELLAEQQSLTAVDRFARRHSRQDLPKPTARYRELIPLTAPRPGEQYAFEVDLDRCSGCKACVSACHSLNGLEDGETWREVGLLFSGDSHAPFQQTVTTSCHHCLEPGCLEGCPVLAYDKDPTTGIVRHLDDQCIGCQYCVMKCPYEVPKYSSTRGIVRKCDMCSGRLAVGEAPACAQACPSQAIRIAIVPIAAAFQVSETGKFLPSAPDPRNTRPTTRYLSARPLPAGLLAGDHARVEPAPSHLPLVFMLVLTQMAVGTGIVSGFFPPTSWLTWLPTVTAILGLGIATLHLGRPLQAWRAFLGWRTSWFSREVIAFGVYLPLAALCTAAPWTAPLAPFQSSFAFLAAAAGSAGIACSALIYASTRRAGWNLLQCFGRFFGTAALLGVATALVFVSPPGMILVPTLIALSILKLTVEFRLYRHQAPPDEPTLSPLNKTARLLTHQLGFPSRLRVLCAVIGGMVFPLLYLAKPQHPELTMGALVFCLAGELLERFLFFSSVAPITMPRGVSA